MSGWSGGATERFVACNCTGACRPVDQGGRGHCSSVPSIPHSPDAEGSSDSLSKITLPSVSGRVPIRLGRRSLPRQDVDPLTRAVEKVGPVGLGGWVRELLVSAA